MSKRTAFRDRCRQLSQRIMATGATVSPGMVANALVAKTGSVPVATTEAAKILIEPERMATFIRWLERRTA